MPYVSAHGHLVGDVFTGSVPPAAPAPGAGATHVAEQLVGGTWPALAAVAALAVGAVAVGPRLIRTMRGGRSIA